MPEDHMEELYSSKNPLVRFVHNGRLEHIVKKIPKDSGIKILDAGCGEGHLLEKILKANSRAKVFGIDITKVALEKAKIRCPKMESLSDTGFQSGFFDVVTCTEVLEHIYEYKKVIGELKRILKPDGLLIITFPNERLWTLSRLLLGRKPVKVPDHINSFSPNIMRKIIDMKIVSKNNLPLNLPFLLSLNCLMVFRK